MVRQKKKTEPAPKGTHHVRLDLEDEPWENLRVLAAKAGMSMASYVRTVIVREVERSKG